MLNPVCEDFRSRFEPHAERREDAREPELEAHRLDCASCAAWTERLETFTAEERAQPMPRGLRSRLLAIPRAAPQAGCRDVDRLYQAALDEARTGETDAEAARHLDGCRRCRTLYGVLAASFRELRRPMPRRLVRRLRRIAEAPGRLPILVRDSRVAVAASALLTASLMLVIGNPTSLFRATAETVSSRATVLAEAGEERQQAVFESLAQGFEARFERGREILVEHGHVYQKLWREAQELSPLRKWRHLAERLTLQGDRDGEI